MKNTVQQNIKSKKPGTANMDLPPITFRTRGLEHLFAAFGNAAKYDIAEECFRMSKSLIAFNSAGRFVAGLALETLGKCLKQLNIQPEDIVINNKPDRYVPDSQQRSLPSIPASLRQNGAPCC